MSSKQQEIAKLAYLLWESRGRPEHTAERDWAEAEVLLSAEISSGGELGMSDVLPTDSMPAAKPATRRKTDRKPKTTTRRAPTRPADPGP